MVNEILLLDESGKVVRAFPNAHALDEVFATNVNGEHSLPYIDPYGDTVFNRLQSERLIEELRHRIDGGASLLDHHIRQLISFAELATIQPHLYIKFVGD